MAAPMEVLVTSDVSAQLWSACVTDINTGASLTSFKGDSVNHRGLCVLANQYLLGASCSKPLIYVWGLHAKDQQQMKVLVCPGKVSCLSVSPDGAYCVAAVAEKIHIWQICSGNLLAVLSRHYQTVNVIRFTDNGSHFVSGGDDNLVIVWSLSSVISSQCRRGLKPEPERIWTSHSLPITDIHIGHGGARARVVSASLDHTCRVWDMVCGELLQTIVFPTSILSVAMDTSEMRMFAGSAVGDIYCVNMYGQPMRTERHIDSADQQGITCLKDHTKQVTCVAVSLDGTKLVSGSHDNSVKIWDVLSGQCVRTLIHKGHVSNTMLIRTPAAILDHTLKPNLQLQPFKRSLYTGNSDEQCTDSNRLALRIAGDGSLLDTGLHHMQLQQNDQVDASNIKSELKKVKAINKELYSFTVNKILTN